MHPTWKTELRALWRLGVPVTVVQVGMMLLGVVDTLMVGRHSEGGQAALALGNFYSFWLMMFGIGTLMALDPVMSQAVGAKDEGAIARNLQRGFFLAILLSIPTCVTFLFAGPALRFAGQPEELIPTATNYIWILIPSVLPALLFNVLRSTMQAYHRTAPVVWAVLLSNVANVLINWVLIYGKLGFPEMGAEGSAVATLVCRWVMFVLLLVIGRKHLWCHLRHWTKRCFALEPLMRLFRVGAPIGAQIVLEVGAFGITLLFMGWISVSALAGHQAAIQLASLTYMVTMGVSVATGVRVGNGVGRGDLSGARWSAVMGLVTAVAIMLVFAALFLAFPKQLAQLFSKNDSVGAVAVAASLLPIAALFQVVDGIQVVCLGALRGVADTTRPMLINIIGFWCLGVPTGYWLAFGSPNAGPQGLWWGLVVGLTVVAILLLHRVWVKLRGDLARTAIDDEDQTPAT